MEGLLTSIGLIAVAIYILALMYITFFCLLQLHLLWQYSRSKDDAKIAVIDNSKDQYPFVTVQLPLYNEKYVVERLIRQVASFVYPKDRFEIQVLDDSTDETTEIVSKLVEEFSNQGVQILHVRRKERIGYKAGALQEGMKTSRGEFIAIFDADFLPNKNFLLETIPSFNSDEIGVVQTRWEHINQRYSLLTELQAFQLNVHFTVEQTGRSNANLFLQFNGTGGVWRTKTIVDAGGWQADTLTEDLDLSYRAQLRGWKIKYLEDIGSPAELPAEMNGLKSQQYRWMKGGAETAKKVLPSVWGSSLPIIKKIHATGHLLSSAIFIFVFIAGVFSVPALITVDLLAWDARYFTFFLLGLMSIASVYLVAHLNVPDDLTSQTKKIVKFILLFPVFLALSMGLSLHNSIAVLQGFFGKKSPFVRTPKFNIVNQQDTFKKKNYLVRELTWSTIGEGFLALYFLFGASYGVYMNNMAFLFYHVLLSIGFGAIFLYSWKHSSSK